MSLALMTLAPCSLAQGPPPPPPPPQGPQGPQEPGPRREPMLLPQAVVLPRGDRQIAIDGSLTDWPELPAIRLDDQRQLSGTAQTAWRGPQDLSGVAFLLWDPQALYVACAVKDEWHRPLDANTLLLTEIPASDSVVLTFDPDRNTRALGPDPGRREDREFWLADENGREVVQWDRLRGTARVLDGEKARMVVLHDKERSVTTYEARIPWSEILPVGREAAAGLVFDMQIVINDFDERTDGMPQTRIGWTFGCSPVVDPGLLGSAMLVADAAPLQGRVPEFPPKPSTTEAPAAADKAWQDLTARLIGVPPAVHDGTKAPEEAGGLARFAVLEEIEAHVARFPRVDFVELHHRIHRRMQREVAGISAHGLPLWWRSRLEAVSKAAEDPVPNGSLRLFRLPMGGWLVRMPQRGFLVDATGADLSECLWGGSDFCVLTQPMDMTKRNDQLLLRMFHAKPPRPVLTHIAFHLPVVAMAEMPLIEPGQTLGETTGVQVQALGRKQTDGAVTWSCSYRIAIPAGPKMLIVGPNLLADEADVGPVDVVILSPRNAEALQIVQRVKPGLVVIDESFVCQSHPGIPRVTLREMHALQKAMRQQASLILAPGESWDVRAARPQ